MDYQVLFNLAVGIIGVLFGVIIKIMWDSLSNMKRADAELAKDVAQIQILVAGEYVKRDYFERKIDAIFKKLDDIPKLISQVIHQSDK